MDQDPSVVVPQTEGTGEDLAAQLEELRRKNLGLAESVSKLQGKNEELISENRKKSRIAKLLQSLEIDPNSEDAEEVLIERLSSLRATPAAATPTSATSTPTGVPGNDSTPEALEMKGKLKLMEKKLADMEKKAQEAAEREQQAIEKRKRDYVELKVKEAFDKAEVIRPSHLYKLVGSLFRLSEDGETIIGGSDSDPRSLQDQVETLKDDPEYAPYFRGSGASGSGMTKTGAGFGGHSLKNPFRSDQRNATDAAAIYQKDPEKAKRLMLEARNAGKLDPAFARLAGV